MCMICAYRQTCTQSLSLIPFGRDDSIYSSAPAQSAAQEDESRNTADAANDAALAHAMQLFVAARERVLTLSEQRVRT